MPDAAALSNVVLQLKCVDGAVAYLNGMEIFRLNMPTGEVNSTTLALESLSEIPHAAFASRHIDSALLVSGLNVLAVEVHLAAPFSPSLLFDCVLTRNYQPGPPRLWFTWPEDYSIQPRGDVLLSAEAFDPDGQVARVEFFVDDMKFGEIDAPPYQMIVSNLPPNSGRHYARARAVDASEDADSIAEVSFSDTDPDGSVPDDLLYLFGPQAYWNYLDDDADPGPAWRDGPNSARWSSGRAPFALGFDWRTIIDGGPTNARHATIYFWGYVRWDVPLAVGSATMYLLSELADGVIVYVNGVEVLRRNLPLGPIASSPRQLFVSTPAAKPGRSPMSPIPSSPR